jgi:hypothetical protein
VGHGLLLRLGLSGGGTPVGSRDWKVTWNMVDFMLVDRGRAWPEYKRVGQAGIYVYPG